MGIPVRELQTRITSKEFAIWRQRFANRLNGFDRFNFYQAHIVAELRRLRGALVGSEALLKTQDSDCLVTFVAKQPETKLDPETVREQRLLNSKAYWGALTSISHTPHQT